MGDLNSFLPILAMLVVVYLFMIRPQTQRQKKEKKFSEELKKGMRVVTKSGLHGRVADISEKLNAIVLETGAGKLTFDRSSISMELSAKLNEAAKEPKEEKQKA